MINDDRRHPSLIDILEAWASNEISASAAIRLGGFSDFGELLATARAHGVDRQMNLAPIEIRQAEQATRALREGGWTFKDGRLQ